MGATEMKIVLIIAGIGHLLCGITDCMLAYTKDGRFDFSDINDNAKMQKTFSSMPLKQVNLAMLIGVFALFMASIGYIEISLWISETAHERVLASGGNSSVVNSA